MRLSLQYKLLAAFMAVVLFVLMAVSAGGSMLLRDYFLDSKRRELTGKAYEVASMVNAYYDGQITSDQLHSFANSADRLLDARVWVVDNELNLITVSAEHADRTAGHGRPAVKPSPMPSATWEMTRHHSRMMERADWPPADHNLDTTAPTNNHRRMMSNSLEPLPEQDGRMRNQAIDNNKRHGMKGMERRSGAGMSPSRGLPTQNMAVLQEAGNNVEPLGAAQQQPVVLDFGKGVQTSASVNGIRLADITGMKEMSEAIANNSGQTWNKTYYHPYYEENMLMVAVPLQRSDQTIAGTVMINAPLTEIDGFLRNVYQYLAYAGFAAIVVAVLLAASIARGIVRPLKAMQQTAAAMACGDYEQRISVMSQDEVGELGHSLNALAQDLGQYVCQLEKTDGMRRNFIANLSHELRTPLTIMRGYNQALQDGTITAPDKVQKYLQVMGDEILRLEKLIAELLELSQLQAGNLAWEAEDISLAEVVDNVMTLVKQKTEQCQVQLTACIDADVPTVQGDGDRLIQLLLILLDNALKFTPADGRICIALKHNEQWAVLSVADTGKGIEEQHLPHIWERFYKAGQSRTDGGTGLGLAIAKEIIELHGAKVEVESSPGQGAAFRLYFPLVLCV